MKLASGQTIVEVVVAIGLVILLVTGLIVSTSVSLKAAQYGKIRSQAVRYAQEAVELARSLRDVGWNALFEYADKTYCLDKEGVWTLMAGACPANIDAFFTRQVTFTWDDPKMRVDVVISWTDGNKTYTVPVSTYVTQWK